MFKGVVFALIACLFWGSIFVLPEFMPTFSPVEIALGRYLFYGLISLILFMKDWLFEKPSYSRTLWVQAFYFALSNIFYYSCIVFGVRLSNPAICALILGLSPVTIALYGNYREKEISFRSLFLPLLLMLVGLFIINAPHVNVHNHHLWGLLFSFLALICWSWFAVANSRLLKNNPQISSSQWTTLIGVMNLAIVGGMGLGLHLLAPQQLNVQQYLTFNPANVQFLGGCAFLGIVCSWIGSTLWNKACLYLPITLAGQLTLFETIFGVIFFYLIQQTLPSFLDMIGISLLLSAIAFSLKQFSKNLESATH